MNTKKTKKSGLKKILDAAKRPTAESEEVGGSLWNEITEGGESVLEESAALVESSQALNDELESIVPSSSDPTPVHQVGISLDRAESLLDEVERRMKIVRTALGKLDPTWGAAAAKLKKNNT